MKTTWDRSAMRFAAARFVEKQRMLDVTFENGDHFLIAGETLLPRATNDSASATADWAGLRIGETGDVLLLPASGDMIEIPWDRVRSIADADFRAHLAEASGQRARRIGTSIRTMRQKASLSQAELAAKLGVSSDMIALLEAGKTEPPIDLIEHVALALGKRLRDFVQE